MRTNGQNFVHRVGVYFGFSETGRRGQLRPQWRAAPDCCWRRSSERLSMMKMRMMKRMGIRMKMMKIMLPLPRTSGGNRMDGVMSSPWDTLVVTSTSVSCSVNHSKLSWAPAGAPGPDPWRPWVGVGWVCMPREFSVPPGGPGLDLNRRPPRRLAQSRGSQGGFGGCGALARAARGPVGSTSLLFLFIAAASGLLRSAGEERRGGGTVALWSIAQLSACKYPSSPCVSAPYRPWVTSDVT